MSFQFWRRNHGFSTSQNEMITKLCTEVRFHKDMAWMDTETGNAFEKALRELWQQAAHMGFAVGEDACWDREQEVAKKLEEERVWGFDVGWKLCSEQQQLRASQASLIPPSHLLPCSLSVAAIQTDDVSVTPVIPAAAASTPAPAAAPAPMPGPLDWAEDAATMPIFPLHSAPPPSTPRDFSALGISSLQPFASLQRRRRRSPRPPNSIRRPQQKSGVHYSTTRRTPLLYSRSPPSIPFPAPTSFPPAKFPLDWDQDPRLRDLGQALTALGWVRL
ncbi:hypothetical protein B0H17DRAFT_1132819 [Mycena rosella]|uniref:Uncharacterized protein n=1 Tax=Mycena rosella TaxID=1033263 RepID=A0AAD7DJ24_MYCRO|nr:hypothetical protein B0H17DRAFT_1132819 [Mycena rosella]